MLLLLLLLEKLSRIYAARVHCHAHIHGYSTSTHELGRIDSTTKDVLREILLLLLLGSERPILKTGRKHGRVDACWIGARTGAKRLRGI